MKPLKELKKCVVIYRLSKMKNITEAPSPKKTNQESHRIGEVLPQKKHFIMGKDILITQTTKNVCGETLAKQDK